MGEFSSFASVEGFRIAAGVWSLGPLCLHALLRALGVGSRLEDLRARRDQAVNIATDAKIWFCMSAGSSDKIWSWLRLG